MKRLYSKPVAYIELFAADQAIASCVNKNVTFDCMKGPNRDTDNVIVSDVPCTNNAAFGSVDKAYNSNGVSNHSDYTNGTWTNGGKSYQGPDGTKGLLALCASGGDNQWRPSQGGQSEKQYNNDWVVVNGVLTHQNTCGNLTHQQIAPTFSPVVNDVKVAS